MKRSAAALHSRRHQAIFVVAPAKPRVPFARVATRIPDRAPWISARDGGGAGGGAGGGSAAPFLAGGGEGRESAGADALTMSIVAVMSGHSLTDCPNASWTTTWTSKADGAAADCLRHP